MKTVTINLTLTKETKGTFVYGTPDESAAITTLYIRKAVTAGAPPPKNITITVEATE